MAVLVTGGAGYIGSHMAYALADRHEKVVVIDNLTTGLRPLVCESSTFVKGDVGDKTVIREILRKYEIDTVMHFAASTSVPESVSHPLLYYANNSANTLALVQSCVEEDVQTFVFSSTAAVYGAPHVNPVNEAATLHPISPYGRSKVMAEWILRDAALAHPFRYVALRYFNVAGADPAGRTGQSTPQASHLVKKACQVALGRFSQLEIFGMDYPTPDGTGERDYIHVSDLVSAHLAALDHLRNGGESTVLNCGYGHGTSVREIIRAVEQISGRKIRTVERERRLGDPARVVADSTQIRKKFGWIPQYDDVMELVRSAYVWECRLADLGL